jgi:hypothetical protein
MVAELEEIIEEIKFRKEKEKGLRNQILLENTISNLTEYKRAKEE